MVDKSPEWSAILKERWERESKEWRDEFIQELDVSSPTVWRWMQGKHGPDSKYKLTVLEKHIPEISDALRRHFPSFYTTSQDLVLRLVAPVSARVLQALARSDASLVMETIVSIVLYALVNHLDVEQLGVVALLGQLRSSTHTGQADHLMINAWSAQGTGLWVEYPANKSYIVGGDSLSALAVLTKQAAFYPRDKSRLAPSTELRHMDTVRSAAAYPILRFGQVAGVIFLASTQPDYFVSHRREIIAQYALMISLAFRDHDFYSTSQVDLFSSDDVDDMQTFAEYQQFMHNLKFAHANDSREELVQRASEYFRHSK